MFLRIVTAVMFTLASAAAAWAACPTSVRCGLHGVDGYFEGYVVGVDGTYAEYSHYQYDGPNRKHKFTAGPCS